MDMQEAMKNVTGEGPKTQQDRQRLSDEELGKFLQESGSSRISEILGGKF